ncbi:MAG TPA: regulatory protein RecX [Thermoanaerobaculia bacterium]|jgi:regulatory protein|nr:regulatory protein RecX [Thermoanaerobaculia bacterium]
MPPSSYDKAVQLLASRPHFRRELAAKLQQRGYPAEEIDLALARLTEQGYLDDRAAARSFLESRLGRNEGRSRLRAELLQRGAPEDVAEEVLAELTPEDDLPAARDAAERWQRQGGRDPRALARHLDRKGFSRRAIVAVLNARAGGLEIDDES